MTPLPIGARQMSRLEACHAVRFFDRAHGPTKSELTQGWTRYSKHYPRFYPTFFNPLLAATNPPTNFSTVPFFITQSHLDSDWRKNSGQIKMAVSSFRGALVHPAKPVIGHCIIAFYVYLDESCFELFDSGFLYFDVKWCFLIVHLDEFQLPKVVAFARPRKVYAYSDGSSASGRYSQAQDFSTRFQGCCS